MVGARAVSEGAARHGTQYKLVNNKQKEKRARRRRKPGGVLRASFSAIWAQFPPRTQGEIWAQFGGSVARSDQNCMAILKKIGNGDETWRKKTRSQDFGDFPRI